MVQEKNMDRLLPLIDEDPRKVRSVSHYLETVGDLTSLSHLLEKIDRKTNSPKIRIG